MSSYLCIRNLNPSDYKIYSRSDIETMSARLGYSVWDRCGGDDCRHRWVSVVVTKKLK
jgi:hypothetical protein